MKIGIRDAELKDSALILSWRNHPSSRIYAKNSLTITEAEHEEWFKKRLANKNTQPFWIFSYNSVEIGYVRLENSEKFLNSFEISINVDFRFQKKGFGQEILAQTLIRVFEIFPTKRIIAKIHINNLNSISIFRKLNFRYIEQDKDFLLLERVNQTIRYIFRADASSQEGVGHILRSIGIIEELISQNHTVYFIGQITDAPWVLKKIESLGFAKILSKESDFEPNSNFDVLILDSYTLEIDSNFVKMDNWKSIVLIFDEFTPKYQAKLGVHPGIRNEWKLENLSKIVSGPRFIPLRKNILKIENSFDEENLVITVLGGGTDSKNFVPEMAKILKNIPGIFTVNLFTNKPNEVVSDHRFKVFKLGNSLDLVGNKTHLAFSTASTSSLEFIARECALGICCTTQNQESYYNDLYALGLAEQIGRYSDGKWDLNKEIIELLVTSKEYRTNCKKNTVGYLDFDGAKRVVQEITSL